MKRQLETKEYGIKDWAVNSISLAEYFIENNHLAQAEYCLFAGINVLPPPDKKRKLRATMQMQLGRYYLYRLRFGVDNLKSGQKIAEDAALFERVHAKFVEFPSL